MIGKECTHDEPLQIDVIFLRHLLVFLVNQFGELRNVMPWTIKFVENEKVQPM